MTDHGLVLPETHKACLRMVLKGMTSKEIGRELGLTNQTVDTYIKLATARLSASNRRDAARRLAEIEHSQDLGSPPPGIGDAVPAADEGVAINAVPSSQRTRWTLLKLPPLGGVTNDLTFAERLFRMLHIAGIMAITMVGFVLFALGALKLLS